MGAILGIIGAIAGKAGMSAGAISFLAKLIEGAPALIAAGEDFAKEVEKAVDAVRAMFEGQRDPTMPEWNHLNALIAANLKAIQDADTVSGGAG